MMKIEQVGAAILLLSLTTSAASAQSVWRNVQPKDNPLNAVMRWSGLGWSDGYHAQQRRRPQAAVAGSPTSGYLDGHGMPMAYPSTMGLNRGLFAPSGRRAPSMPHGVLMNQPLHSAEGQTYVPMSLEMVRQGQGMSPHRGAPADSPEIIGPAPALAPPASALPAGASPRVEPLPQPMSNPLPPAAGSTSGALQQTQAPRYRLFGPR